jgi:hypothetical protein
VLSVLKSEARVSKILDGSICLKNSKLFPIFMTSSSAVGEKSQNLHFSSSHSILMLFQDFLYYKSSNICQKLVMYETSKKGRRVSSTAFSTFSNLT